MGSWARLRAVALAMLLVVAGSGDHAVAQPADDTANQQSAAPGDPPAVEDPAQLEARRLTEQGTRAWQANDHATALAYFELARAVFPSPRIDYNIGLALLGLERPLAAYDAFARFLAGAPEAPEANRNYARATLTELDGRLGRITITTSVDGASLSIDGRSAALHQPVRVLPGYHTAVVRKPGLKSAVADLQVAGGQRVNKRLDPLIAPIAPAPAETPMRLPLVAPSEPVEALPSRQHGLTRGAWVAIGVVGTLVVGAAVGAAVLMNRSGSGCSDSALGCQAF